jgi:hypothetical protein
MKREKDREQGTVVSFQLPAAGGPASEVRDIAIIAGIVADRDKTQVLRLRSRRTDID